MSYKPPRLRIPWPRWYGENQDSNKEVENYKAIERWADQIVVPAGGGGGGAYGAVDYIRASATSAFATPSWSTDFESGAVSRSGGTLILSVDGIWHVSFGIVGSVEVISNGPVIGAVGFGANGESYTVALGTKSTIDNVCQFGGFGGMDIRVVTSATMTFTDWGLTSAYDTDTLNTPNGTLYMAAYYVGPLA